MHKFLILAVAFLLVSCATATKQTDALVKSHPSLAHDSKISNIALIKQKRNHCGPATMAMVMKHAGKKVTLEELTRQMFTEKMQGTFQSDMLSTARYQGMLTIQINDLVSLIKEVSAGRPVIVFQNLGTEWWPKWHYSVVVGHDFSGPDVLLHSGDNEYQRVDMRLFERSWLLGGYWGLLVLAPDQTSLTASELSHVQAASMLENLGDLKNASTAYQTILSKWPQSLGALIGLGNVTYNQKNFKKATEYLSRATQLHPESAIAWHNLAFAQESLGKNRLAAQSAKKAMGLVDKVDHKKFQESLNHFLTP